MKTRNLLWLSAVLLTVACSNEEESSIISSMPIQFSANISKSRVSGEAWEANDKIGITMSGNEITPIENVAYVLQTINGQFQAESTALQFPHPASDVTFQAYYPYNMNVKNNILTFNADGKTDVLWAEKTIAANQQTSNTVELNFSHVLSQITLKTYGFPKDITISLSGKEYSQATLNIADGSVSGVGTAGIVSIALTETGTNEYSAIVLPISATDKTLTIKSTETGKEWEYTLTSTTYEQGYNHIYKVNVESNVVIKDQITQWIPSEPINLENQTESEIENRKRNRTNFSATVGWKNLHF